MQVCKPTLTHMSDARQMEPDAPRLAELDQELVQARHHSVGNVPQEEHHA